MGKNLDYDNEPEELEDRIPISVQLNLEIKCCDCCGKNNLKRTIEISFEGAQLHLGVICAGRWFDVNLSGNPWYAATRLAGLINCMDSEELDAKVEEIKEASQSWK